MKLNKVKKTILILTVIIFMILWLGQNVIYAASESLNAALDTYRYLPIYNAGTNQYTYNSTGWGFQISASGHKIYQINELDSSNKITGENSRLYCLNAKVGDGWNNNSVGTVAEYKTSYNMKTQKSTILSSDTNNVLTSDYYSAVMWLLDNLYIPNKTDKTEFFENAEIGIENNFYITVKSTGEKYYPYHYKGTKYTFATTDFTEFGYCYQDTEGNVKGALLPDEIIETVQQAAIWYFTNYKDYNKEEIFNCYTKNEDTPTWLYYTTNGTNYSALSSYEIEGYDFNNNGDTTDNTMEVGKMYQEQATILYNYLVDSALAANTAGYTGNEEQATMNIDSSKAQIQEQADGTYKIGPLTIETAGTVSGISLTSTVGTIPSTIKAGENFYISDIPSSFEGKVVITVSGTGENNTTSTLWTGSGNQPIVEIDRKNTPLSDNTEFTIVKEKNFDLALRKTITGIKNSKGTVISILNENGLDATRRITVDSATIPDTATYKHRKDPVIVGNGYKVTYKLSIYNEGDIDGYASIIVDQLATGLESTLKVGDTVTSSKGNIYTVETYNSNKLVLKLTGESAKVINAYTTGTPDNDTIEIECKVTQKEDTSVHYLTNIGYINEAKDLNGNVQTQDRNNTESKPSEYPNKIASDLNNTEVTYKGKSSNQSIYNDTNNEYYYQGQEDDDDFETVVLLPKEFDLKLVKYISAVNGDTSKGKTVTKIDTTNLALGKNTTNTTADYTLSKNVVTVEKGDYVTYTFRVYNEGELDGYVTKLTDNIPVGLQFVQTSIKNDGKTITEYSYDKTNGITSTDIEVDEETYKLVDSNNSYWTIDTLESGDVKVDTYDGDRTPSISANVKEYLGGTNKLLNAYDSSKDTNHNGNGLTYVDVTVVLKVADTASINKVMRNEAAITGHTDADGKSITDRDSETENWLGKDNHDKYQDDEDYDNIKLVRFDLALRKFITAISSDATIENGEYINTKIPEIDTSKLKTGEDQTAIYNHSKDAITVNAGNYVLYTIRVYNEGELDGYASKVTDYLPEYLNYIDGEFNKSYGWEYNSSDRSVTTKYLSSENGASNILKAFDAKKDNGEGSGLSYKDLQILCRVSTDAIPAINITNITEITEYQDKNGTVKDNDTDSDPSNLKYPEDVAEYEGDRKRENASSTYYPGQEDDDDFDRVIVIKGSYDVILIKQDEEGNKLDSKAIFEVNGKETEVKGQLTIAEDVEINVENVGTEDIYTIVEKEAPEGYSKFGGTIEIKVQKKVSEDGTTYELGNVEYRVIDIDGKTIITKETKNALEIAVESGKIYVKVKDYKEPEIHKGVKTVENQDSGYNGKEEQIWVIESEIPGDIARYKKYEIIDEIDYRLSFNGVDNVEVKIGDTILEKNTDYRIEYTENASGVEEKTTAGTMKITFIDKENGIKVSSRMTDNAGGKITVTFKTKFAIDEAGNLLVQLGEDVENQAKVEYKNSAGNDGEKESEKPEVHTGGVALYKYYTEEGEKRALEGAEFAIYGSQEDAETGQNAILTATSDADGIVRFVGLQYGEDAKDKEENKTENGTYEYDSSKQSTNYWVIETKGPEGYIYSSEPIEVTVNKDSYKEEIELIPYQVENMPIKGSYDVILIKQDEEGNKLDSKAIFEVNGKETEVNGQLTIAEDVKINVENVGTEDIYTIVEKEAPEGYNKLDGTIEVVAHKGKSEDGTLYELKKIEYKVTDKDGNESETNDVKVYLKDRIIYVEVKDKEQKFDLALRKFITKINEEDVTTRIPEVSYENEKITYTHPKDVVKLVVGDTVTYTIRVYNEGKTAGYAQTVTDDIPEYLEYLPKNETNKTYRWKMYDKDGNETEDVTKADKIVTDYTSKEYGEELMGADEKLTENQNLLNAFDSSTEISDTNPEYVDVKVAFKVKDPNSSSYIIKNKAQISEDSDENGNPVTDIDSVPNEWNDGEDDQDYENVSVEYFDLSLLKYVSEVEVTENGTTTTTKTGNKGDKNDIIPKVEIHRKNLDSTTVKFIYTIKITNEGDIPGYATEITDYVPEGLEFNTEDNKGWEEKEDGVITTTLLSDTLLKPGESATVKVTFRWINDEENLGVKTNIAEISDDDNEDGIPDRDSTPGNKKDGEDDIDDADVLLSIKTGMTENIIAYVTGAAIILLVLASGVILIKKFVL